MAKENKKNTSLRLEPKILKQLKIIAIEQDSSVQAIVERLVTDYVKVNKKSKKQV